MEQYSQIFYYCLLENCFTVSEGCKNFLHIPPFLFPASRGLSRRDNHFFLIDITSKLTLQTQAVFGFKCNRKKKKVSSINLKIILNNIYLQ